MMCATMPDEPEPREIVLHPEIVEVVSEMTDEEDAAEPNTKEKEAPHLKQQRWSAQKRLKKVQVQTMENVYRRTKRPTVSKNVFPFMTTKCIMRELAS